MATLRHFCSFFDNCMNIFHINEVPTVILRHLMCLNLIWIKSYKIKHKLFCFFLFVKLLNLTKLEKRQTEKFMFYVVDLDPIKI